MPGGTKPHAENSVVGDGSNSNVELADRSGDITNVGEGQSNE
jgi:hypothetical protein